MPDEICLRCARKNEKAWRWYEREGFVFENEVVSQTTGLMMKQYRWREVRRRPMMKLYWWPRTRSFTALWLMEETGQPYERVLTDISTGAQTQRRTISRSIRWARCRRCRTAKPTLGEAAAICAYVAERYPDAKLAPPSADPARAKYLLVAVLQRRAASSLR